jgi:hypothetical protein
MRSFWRFNDRMPVSALSTHQNCIIPPKGGISIFVANSYQFSDVDTLAAQLAYNR